MQESRWAPHTWFNQTWQNVGLCDAVKSAWSRFSQQTVYFTKCWGKSVRCRLKFYNLWPLPLNNHQLMFMKTFNNLSAVYPSILYRSSNSVTFLSVWVEYGCTTAAPPGHHCADSKWHRQCKMAALRSRICWLHFSTEGGSGDQRFKLNLDCCLNFNSWHSNEVSVSY